MKTTETTFTEFEFNATDLDSQDSFSDVVLINDRCNDADKLHTAIFNHMKQHSIASISGNTWDLNGYEPTGKRVLKVVTYTETSARLEEYATKEYPTQNFD